jgi:hypothetical protein
MDNFTQIVTTSGTTNTNTAGNFSGVPCSIHGWQPCACNLSWGNGTVAQYICPQCGIWTATNVIHSCVYTSAGTQWPPLTSGTAWTGTTVINGWGSLNPNFKDVKEITTDSDLRCELDGSLLHMHLPSKFNDCFLKVGHVWSPLYPLIFSAFENDSKEMSFHLVTAISDKTFDGDDVVLKSVTTIKIEDNLTLIQLSQRAQEYFKDDKTNSPVQSKDSE